MASSGDQMVRSPAENRVRRASYSGQLRTLHGRLAPSELYWPRFGYGDGVGHRLRIEGRPRMMHLTVAPGAMHRFSYPSRYAILDALLVNGSLAATAEALKSADLESWSAGGMA